MHKNKLKAKSVTTEPAQPARIPGVAKQISMGLGAARAARPWGARPPGLVDPPAVDFTRAGQLKVAALKGS